MIGYHVEVDTSDADSELDRLRHGPDQRCVIDLESVLAEQFAATQMFVHIITGSLRDSGQFDGRKRGPEWTGEIVYGDNDPKGVNASQERGRDPELGYAPRGWLKGYNVTGDPNDLHDFLRPVYPLEEGYERAVEEFLRGTTR
jgi:hypothetical protein